MVPIYGVPIPRNRTVLRLLFNLADKKTSTSLEALGGAIAVESEVYCRRRSGNFWRMRASLGLACAQAATLGTQVVGRPRSRPRAAARPRARAPSSGPGSLPAPPMDAAFSSLF